MTNALTDLLSTLGLQLQCKRISDVASLENCDYWKAEVFWEDMLVSSFIYNCNKSTNDVLKMKIKMMIRMMKWKTLLMFVWKWTAQMNNYNYLRTMMMKEYLFQIWRIHWKWKKKNSKKTSCSIWNFAKEIHGISSVKQFDQSISIWRYWYHRSVLEGVLLFPLNGFFIFFPRTWRRAYQYYSQQNPGR